MISQFSRALLFYIYRELKDFLLLYLLPMIPLIFPWALSFKVFKRVSKHFPIYNPVIAGNYNQARKYYPDLVEKQFSYSQRLLLLIDNADFWLSRFRPAKMLSLVRPDLANQDWPSSQGYIALGLHWGTGVPALAALSRHNLNPRFVFSDPKFSFSQQGFLESAYKNIRRNWFHKIADGQAIVVGKNAFNEIELSVSDNHVPVILYDAPQNHKPEKTIYKLKNKHFSYQIASGFVTIITSKAVPYVLFSYKLDINTGYRQARITKPKTVDDTNIFIKDLSNFFFENLDSDPSLWHFWKQSPHILKET